MIEKQLLRNKLQELLKEQNSQRKRNAEKSLFSKIYPLLSSYSKILSFCSLSSEIDLKELNLALSHDGKLNLPKIVGNELWIYQVKSLKDLKINHWGIYEPDPSVCELVLPEEIEIILVPALGFDIARNRLGRGRGFYDRLLKPLTKAQSWGIGYKEQLVDKVPITTDDVALSSVYLF